MFNRINLITGAVVGKPLVLDPFAHIAAHVVAPNGAWAVNGADVSVWADIDAIEPPDRRCPGVAGQTQRVELVEITPVVSPLQIAHEAIDPMLLQISIPSRGA